MAGQEKDWFTGKYFRVTVDESGYERVYQRHGVTVLAITEDEKIRFIEKTTTENQTPRIALVTGYVDDGEDPFICAKRELLEEMHCTAEAWMPFISLPMCGGLKKIQHCYIARDLRWAENAIQPDLHEQILGTVDLDFNEVRARVLRGDFDRSGPDNCFALLRFLVLEGS